MIFCYRDVHDFRTDFNCSYKLGYAFSYDLIQWKRDDSILSLSIENNDWDSGMQCYPHVFQVDNKLFLLYNGNEFGKYGFGAAELIK